MKKMYVGDIVTDLLNKQWLIFDKSVCEQFIYVVDLNTQLIYDYLSISHIIEVNKKPSNISWIFLARRLQSYKNNGLENFL